MSHPHRRGAFGAPRRSYSRGRPSGRRVPKQYIDPARFVKKAVATINVEHTIRHSFADFGLDPRLLQNITSLGFTQPLPIQDQAIPPALSGSDIIGLANTGTGKTAAFAIPLINHRLGSRRQTLILAPTRELAIQIESDIRSLSQGLGLRTAITVGGQPIWKQKSQIAQRPDFVIGTPGRLKDLLERKFLNLSAFQALVLDEVDRMVDMGFIHDIKSILSHMPAQRQSLFFTATIPPKIEDTMRTFLHNPVKISVKLGDTVDSVEQDVVRVAVGENKFDKLHTILSDDPATKALVFGETKRGVEKISQALAERGMRSVTIHGNKSQSQRQRALGQFRQGQPSVMIATDVAARGLDIKDITHVINFDTPSSYDDYVHRIGRAGRAGNQGMALTFVN